MLIYAPSGEGARAKLLIHTVSTFQEDQVLLEQIHLHGRDNWSEVAKGVKGRNGKSCRLRWDMHLSRI